MDNIKSMDVGSGIRLHTLNTDKFKTTTLCLYIHNNIDSSASMNALIPQVLKSGSVNYKSSTDISEYLEDMYGAVFEADTVKKGEIQSILFYMQFISQRYAGGDNILFKAVDFLSDIILNPIVQDGGFKREYVSLEKNNLKERIAARINDKVQYAVERCLETMCKNEPYAIYKYGNIEDIDKVDEKTLYEQYREIINSRPIDIFLVGDIGSDGGAAYINDKFNILGRSTVELNSLNITGGFADVKVITESMSVNQGKLCLGYRTKTPMTDSRYSVLSVYTSILGGGLHSKLFQNVREKESLAYYAYSALEKFKGLMVINSGIDTDKYNRAVDIIQEQVDEMKKGNISDYEIKSSKNKLRSDLQSIGDNVPLMIDYYLGGLLYGKVVRPEDMIAQIEKVDIKEVVETAQNINLDTIYFLKPDKKEGQI